MHFYNQVCRSVVVLELKFLMRILFYFLTYLLEAYKLPYYYIGEILSFKYVYAKIESRGCVTNVGVATVDEALKLSTLFVYLL